MLITLTIILCTIQMLSQQCRCLNLLDLSDYNTRPNKNGGQHKAQINYEAYTPIKPPLKGKRRYWLVHDPTLNEEPPIRPRVYEDEKDTNIKTKIATLVQQTMHDTNRKVKSIEELKNEHREEAPYRAGFIMNLIKKSKDVLDELFNVAVKHRDEWMALEQLKIFELIVHTNVDTTNLLRQLVDIHVKHLNSTQSDKKRVILL